VADFQKVIQFITLLWSQMFFPILVQQVVKALVEYL
jgi:hypothetical protein